MNVDAAGRQISAEPHAAIVDQHPSPPVVSKQSRFPAVLEVLTFTFAAFVALAWTGFDLVRILGLDLLVGEKLTSSYTILRLLLDLLSATLFAGFIRGFKVRTMQQVAEEVPKAVESVAQKPNEAKLPNAAKPEAPPTSDSVTQVTKNLNIRVTQLIRQSTLIYWTIIFSLIAGVILIIFAGALSSLDTTLGAVTTRLESQRDEVLRSVVRSSTPDDAKSNLERLRNLDQLYGEVIKAYINQASNNPEKKADWNWSSTILRIGVIGMLVFLTQILISLYRYNSRLISFYGSRRDALLVSSEQPTGDIKELTEIFFPADLDFGKEPRHPFMEMINFIRAPGRSAAEPVASGPSPRNGKKSRQRRRSKQS